MKRDARYLFGALLALYLLHNDWWSWNDPSFAFGLPVGLTYHVLYMAITSFVMFLLVRGAWPSHLEVEDDGEQRR